MHMSALLEFRTNIRVPIKRTFQCQSKRFKMCNSSSSLHILTKALLGLEVKNRILQT